MKAKTMIGVTLLFVFSLFAVVGYSQNGPAQAKNSDSSTCPAMTGHMGHHEMMHEGMMSGGMMHRSMMGKNMMGNYDATQKLIDQLEADLTAAKAQAGSSAVKSKLADAGSTVTQIKQQLSQIRGMMHNSSMQANQCPWAGIQQKQK